MNRRTFFRNLILGIAAVPAAIKSVGTKTWRFDEWEYLKTVSFKMEPGVVYFVPDVSGNYVTTSDYSHLKIEGDIDIPPIIMLPARSC